MAHVVEHPPRKCEAPAPRERELENDAFKRMQCVEKMNVVESLLDLE